MYFAVSVDIWSRGEGGIQAGDGEIGRGMEQEGERVPEESGISEELWERPVRLVTLLKGGGSQHLPSSALDAKVTTSFCP